MPRILDHVRPRILQLHRDGLPAKEIQAILSEGGNVHSINGIKGVIQRFEATDSLSDAPRRHPTKLSEQDMAFIHQRMLANDETTAADLKKLFEADGGRTFSLATLRRAKVKLGWVATGAKYCQLIRNVNRVKRLEFAMSCLAVGEQFEDVIFTDESSVQLDQHARVCFRHVDPVTGVPRARTLKPRPKHPTKVHVWAGISSRGATQIQIFDGIMDQTFYQSILQECLLPFIADKYPEGHRFMQDNDPKHTSRATKAFMQEKGINWWPTPPESPDLNPIEHVWNEMKHFLRKNRKPRTKQQLIDSLEFFWDDRMKPEKCRTYISSLAKALPKVVECEGRATGY